MRGQPTARLRTPTLAATAALAVAMLVVGTRPRPPAALRRIPDWGSHGAAYAALSFLSTRSAALLGAGLPPLAGWGFAVAHGALLELLQMAVPSRAAEWRDLLADALGGAAGAALAAARRRP
jgi:VanZ family protein